MIRIILASLFFCNVVKGQTTELLGTYISAAAYESIKFVGKDSFYFRGFYCSQSPYGRGTCKIENNFLYLNFENIPPNKRHNLTKKDSIAATLPVNDFSTITFDCVDENERPVQFISVSLLKNNQTTSGTLADNDGKGKLKVKKTEKAITLKVSGVGYETKTIILNNASTNYYLKIYVQKILYYTYRLIDGQVYTYEIDFANEDEISMRHKNSRSTFYLYKKR